MVLTRQRRPRKEVAARVLLAIHDLTQELGYPPTYREIGARVGLSHGRVFDYVRELIEAGLVHEKARTARSLRLTDAGRDQLAARELAAAV